MCTDKNILNIFSKIKNKLYLYSIYNNIYLYIRMNSIKNVNLNNFIGVKKR